MVLAADIDPIPPFQVDSIACWRYLLSYVVGAANSIDDPIEPWRRLQERLDPLLSNPEQQTDFAAELEAVALDVLQMTEADPDMAILAMVRLDPFDYAVAHALQSAVACDTYGHSAGTPVEQRVILIQAALTMNISMLALQREMEWQNEPPTPEQRELIRLHPLHSCQQLEALGIRHRAWLQAVAEHHESEDGNGYPTGCRSLSAEADVLAVADRYCALLSRRGPRESMTSNRAARALYSASYGKRQALVSRMVEVFGQHPPGSLVKLASGELAIVVRRGNAFQSERVCALLAADGEALGTVLLRDTSEAEYAIVASIPDRDFKGSIDYSQIRQAIG
jgi:HD-GYP domain-containing protein (c-di-GMP phosphodiesterase class II)